MFEIVINHSVDDVKDVITQFVARRSYRLVRPWYLEDVRVEAPQLADDQASKPKGFWSSFVEYPPPYIDVEVKKRRRGAKVIIKPSSHQNSPLIGYDLQAFLHDERVYDSPCPPVCPRCANGVPNPASRYCGRCGHALLGGGSADGRDERVRNDVLEPGGMMYAGAPLITPVDLPAAEDGDVLTPAPVVEMVDEQVKDDKQAVEMDDAMLASSDDVAPVEIERDEELAQAQQPVATVQSDTRDDEHAAPVKIERKNVESARSGDDAETDETTGADVSNEIDEPDAHDEAASQSEQDTPRASTERPVLEEKAEVPEVVPPEPLAEADESDAFIDDDEEPPPERRLLAED